MLEEFLKKKVSINASINEPNSRNSFQITIIGKLSNEKKFSQKFENIVNDMKKNGFTINLPGYLTDIQNEISKNDFLIVSFSSRSFWNNCY